MQFVVKRDNIHRNHHFTEPYPRVTAFKAEDIVFSIFEYRFLGRIVLNGASNDPRKKIYAIEGDIALYIALFINYQSMLDGCIKDKFTLKPIEGQ
ncbi:MAG: hypothetical protein ACFFB3_09825 [Candidatus Hodarchaeota archaeon]